MPTSVGYQDLAALIARQPAVTERWRQHIRTSTFGTIHAATFSFPRPMGAAIPDPYFTQLASLDPRALEVTGSISLQAPIETVTRRPKYDFPQVDRSKKGDRLIIGKPPVDPVSAPPGPDVPGKKDQASLTDPSQPAGAHAIVPSAPRPSAARKGDRAVSAVTSAADAALDRAVTAMALVEQATRVAVSALQAADAPDETAADAVPPVNAVTADTATQRGPNADQPPAAAAPAQATSQLNTETADLESSRADIYGPIVIAAPKPAAPARKPVTALAPESTSATAPTAESKADAPAERAPGVDDGDRVVDALVQFAQPEKQTTLFFGTHAIGFGQGSMQPWEPDQVPTVLAAPHVDPEIKRVALDPLPDAVIDTEASGETVAPKGEVTGEGHRPRTPAERLNLSGVSRAKHEQCLANAVYFEARGEVERGQMAVAQVVLNRAFSGYYPGNVCDVVYQNAHRHLACQFTFACDNHRDVVREPEAWETASRIARDALDGKFWLPEVGKATHYHATYVRPWWVRTMTKHTKLGIHIFYRPRRWGEGEEIPVWGDRLDVTGSINAQKPSPEKSPDDKRAEAQPVVRRSIFDPVEEIKPGG